MEENKLIESKKILTDYMLELNRDIQSAEDWANTGADEEMYFALQTVLNELERYKRIKPVDLDGEYTLSIEEFLNVSDKLYELERNSIPKQVIRDKFYEVAQKRKKYWGKEYPQQLSKAEFIKSMKMLGVIKFCEELLGEKNE